MLMTPPLGGNAAANSRGCCSTKKPVEWWSEWPLTVGAVANAVYAGIQGFIQGDPQWEWIFSLITFGLLCLAVWRVRYLGLAKKLADTADDFREENDRLSEQVDTFASENEKLADQVDTFSAENEKLADQVDTFSAENKKLAGEVDAFSAENEKLGDEVDAFSVENEKLGGEVDAFSVENQRLAVQVDAFGAENKKFEAQNRQFSENVAALEGDVEKFRAVLEISSDNAEETQKKLFAETEKYRLENNRFEANNLLDLFLRLDMNHDLELSIDEITTMQGFVKTVYGVDYDFSQLDGDHNGRVNLAEFVDKFRSRKVPVLGRSGHGANGKK
uniref:EF-hand domain-containing protein n=1 Tax=Marseillevirus LCMAC103 TaxID=2506604 RepID=A0A481YWC9_9VIRU|nr:MAG: uncharacterized protein LCMAC103_01640 [Marseillevirus LCMAC103]